MCPPALYLSGERLASFFFRSISSWTKIPEINAQMNPIHNQSVLRCVNPRPSTKMLRRLIAAVRKVLSFNPDGGGTTSWGTRAGL